MMASMDPIHPEEILLTEFLEPMGISQYRPASETSRRPWDRIPAVVENLFKLNAAIMQLYCLEDDEFVIRVTGGDRYIDCAGNHVSLTTGKIVPNSSSTSPHLIERGARGVDFEISGTTLTPEQIDLALAQTEFTPGNTDRSYDDGHTHIALAPVPCRIGNACVPNQCLAMLLPLLPIMF